MTKIFISIDWFSPAYKAGGPVQSVVNLVNTLNTDIYYYIICSNEDVDGKVLDDVSFNQWVQYNAYTSVYYISRDRRSVSIFKKLIKRIDPGIIYINGLYSWFFNIIPLLFINFPRKIISVRGTLHPGALSEKKIKKKLYLLLLRLTGIQKKVTFHATDESEKNYIINVFGQVNVVVATNYARPIPRQLLPKKVKGELSLISISLISPMKNILLVLQSLQKIKERVFYNIYGAIKEINYWKLCIDQIELLPENISVAWHGDIKPERVAVALQSSHVFILPSKSENFGHAIYEALSAGKPVITSHNTPWKKLEHYLAGINVSIDKTFELESAIHFFLALDHFELEQWSINASNYAQKEFKIEDLNKQYTEMFIHNNPVT